MHQHQASGAAEIAYKEQQDFHVGHNGGYLIPIHSKIRQEMRIHFEKSLNEYGMKDLIPVYLEKDVLNFYLNREVKSEEIYSVNDAEQCLEKDNQQSGNEYGRAVRPTTTLNRDGVPIGDDIEPVRESRVDVETGNEEESLEDGIPTFEMIQKNPTSREKQEHEVSGHVLLSVEGRGVGGQHRLELLEEEERERTTPIVAFDYGFLTGKRRHVSNVVNGKVPQHASSHFLSISSKILIFAESFLNRV